ncbi:MAG: phosphoribosylformylglycinamidine synthase subunit PurL [Candidatus Omnitrophica bacterium]|nr:phosphoribosylformylglycinamidine synthase subunit PurL [Candidatus Omnitrophota bacterium]MCM8801952.1 phosphoribosylformylglycinamidine synthase subunit PurL [Candidatus Omnitrophota bacterium]
MNYVREIDILNADEKELIEISEKNLLSLDIEEMKKIKEYFLSIGRNPTDCELECIAQTWSEHCYHKTFKANIQYIEKNGKKIEKFNICLLREIMEVTEKLNYPWCISVFKDNAGIIKINEKYGAAFKVETHNHPSALEPYGGAGTGIGGVIRDILGVGLGAKPILNTDIFCFGPLDFPYEKLPEGVLHPKRIFRGVVSGVRDYGNRMGIPTANGAIIFDDRYVYNCLVYCGCVGIIPVNKIEKKVNDGDLIVVIGGRTGRDGIHGATFSSASLKENIPTSVVQIGNPIVEKKFQDVLLVARDLNLYNSITDCGAGGFSSAIGEMGKDIGAVVYLEKVPLKYEGLLPWEIFLSESQERMVLAVPEKKVEKLINFFASEDVEATVIGKFVKTGKLTVYYKNKLVCDIDIHFLHKGIPKKNLRGFFERKREKPVNFKSKNIKEDILKVLSSPIISSKEEVIRQYDHEVGGRTILKPFVGYESRGVSDGVVLKPFYETYEGLIISCGINPFYGEIDPYYMAGCCIEECIRNIVSCGGNPEKIAILDNFCWGNISDERELGNLIRCVKGCKDYALKYRIPFISGKDSLNNYFKRKDGKIISIPGTLLISGIGIIEDVRKICSTDFKKEGNIIFVLGKTFNELGSSQFYRVNRIKGGIVPKPRPEKTLSLMKKIHIGIKNQLIKSCHDCSDGGLITTICEMMIGGNLGCKIDFSNVLTEEKEIEIVLFSESCGRFVVEIEKEKLNEFEKLFKNEELSQIGEVIEEKELIGFWANKKLFKIPLELIYRSWTSLNF